MALLRFVSVESTFYAETCCCLSIFSPQFVIHAWIYTCALFFFKLNTVSASIGDGFLCV